MNLRKRLEKLERGFGCGGTLTLLMPDGSHKILTLHGLYGTLDLFQRCFSEPHCPEAELIRASVEQIDSNGGHMGELIACYLNSPAKSTEEVAP